MATPLQGVSVSLTACVSQHASNTKTRYNSRRLLFHNRNLKTLTRSVNNTTLQMKWAHTWHGMRDAGVQTWQSHRLRGLQHTSTRCSAGRGSTDTKIKQSKWQHDKPSMCQDFASSLASLATDKTVESFNTITAWRHRDARGWNTTKEQTYTQMGPNQRLLPWWN